MRERKRKRALVEKVEDFTESQDSTSANLSGSPGRRFFRERNSSGKRITEECCVIRSMLELHLRLELPGIWWLQWGGGEKCARVTVLTSRSCNPRKTKEKKKNGGRRQEWIRSGEDQTGKRETQPPARGRGLEPWIHKRTKTVSATSPWQLR
ncbi:hypothetical protein Mapa_003288 [Marchantia paleacea]|nr:hypothetical protein Mapa_003288 [Marchantia paleacea]